MSLEREKEGVKRDRYREWGTQKQMDRDRHLNKKTMMDYDYTYVESGVRKFILELMTYKRSTLENDRLRV